MGGTRKNNNAKELEREVAILRAQLSEYEENARLLVRRDLELARANEQLRALDKNKTKFISVAAHQLRTPLSSLRWTLEFVLTHEGAALSEQARRLLQKALETNIRLVQIVNDLLSVDRIESGRDPLHVESVDLSEVVSKVVRELTPQAQRKGVALIIETPKVHVPPIGTDAKKARAIVQNVVDNAIKYTPKGGAVTVAVGFDAASSEAVLVVADNGIGIPHDQLDNLYKKFFRARNAVKTATEGSGVGLFIVKEYVDALHGTITCKSEEGRGTRFEIRLPSLLSKMKKG